MKQSYIFFLKYRFIINLLLILFAFSSDQLSKYWVLKILDLPQKHDIPITSFMDLEMVWNYAITFGWLGGYSPWIFISFSFLIIIILFVRLLKMRQMIPSVACCVIIGGALGNLADRIHYGAVVDFIDWHIIVYGEKWSWYVFNIADSFIVSGVVLWVFYSFFLEKAEVKTLDKKY